MDISGDVEAKEKDSEKPCVRADVWGRWSRNYPVPAEFDEMRGLVSLS